MAKIVRCEMEPLTSCRGNHLIEVDQSQNPDPGARALRLGYDRRQEVRFWL
jgi:hypothetical protein